MADSIALKRLRKNIIRLKAAAGFRTNTELAETAKIGKNVLTGILKHGTGARWENLDALALALGVDLSELFAEPDDKKVEGRDQPRPSDRLNSAPVPVTTGGEYDEAITQIIEAIIRTNPHAVAKLLAERAGPQPSGPPESKRRGPRLRPRTGDDQ